MKKCPKCRTEYVNDSMEICPNDDTVLETVGAQATDETMPVREVSAANATTAGQSRGMSALAKSLMVILALLGIGGLLVFLKSNGTFGGHGDAALNHIAKEDMAILLKDANPMQLKQLSDNPEAKKKISESLKQLLAVASQARKDGIADDPNIKRELENIRSVLTAQIYDQKINGDKGPMPPFGYITEEQTKEFWNDASHEGEFKEFIDSKIALAKESGKFPKDKELTEDEIKQAKDDYAKIRIYEAEAKAKAGELGEEFSRELELQVKLQQSQFLASQYAQKTLVEKVKVSDEEVQAYIAAHPEFSPAEKKAKAEEVLKRVQGGEDFGKVADEISEDPGTKGNGGLYKDVTMGKMMPAFEQAALALEPGKISDQLVETPYGFHIIKLESKGEGKGADGKAAPTYNVRHILIGTSIKDPNNPLARPMPANEMARQTLETEKQKKVLDEIVANNPVEVAEDFDIPAVSDEQMQQMMQQQMQMPGGGMSGDEDMPSASADDSPPKAGKQPKTAPKKK